MALFQQQSPWLVPPNLEGPDRFNPDPPLQVHSNPPYFIASLLAPWRLNPALIPRDAYEQGYQEDPTQAPFNRSITWFTPTQLAPWWLNPARIPRPGWEQGYQQQYALDNNPAIFSFGMRVVHFEDPWVSPSEIINHMNNLAGSGSTKFQVKVVGVIQNLSIEILQVESPM